MTLWLSLIDNRLYNHEMSDGHALWSAEIIKTRLSLVKGNRCGGKQTLVLPGVIHSLFKLVVYLRIHINMIELISVTAVLTCTEIWYISPGVTTDYTKVFNAVHVCWEDAMHMMTTVPLRFHWIWNIPFMSKLNCKTWAMNCWKYDFLWSNGLVEVD